MISGCRSWETCRHTFQQSSCACMSAATRAGTRRSYRISCPRESWNQAGTPSTRSLLLSDWLYLYYSWNAAQVALFYTNYWLLAAFNSTVLMYKKIPIVNSIKNWFDKKVNAVNPPADIKENLLAPEQREIIKVWYEPMQMIYFYAFIVNNLRALLH